MKTNQILKDWIIDFKSDNNNGYSGFYTKYFGNKKLYDKLSKAIEKQLEIDSICLQIYKFAQSKNSKLNKMVLDFLPIILENYLILSFSSNKNDKNFDSCLLLIRTCLLSIYNLLKPKLPDENEKDKPLLFIPTFMDGSIFHAPVGRPDLDLINYSLIVSSQPGITVINDKQLIPGLIQTYNQFLSDYSATSLENYCNLTCKIASLKTNPRIDVTSETLNELASGIYFLLFKQTHVVLATNALKTIEIRANYEIMTSVMLTVNAIQNSFSIDYTEHPIGLKTIIKPRAETLTNENVITNASFKPEKISEDLVHLLDVNQNNPTNKSIKLETSPHYQINKNEHITVEPSDVNIQFKSSSNSSTNPKSSNRIKFSLKSDKSQQQQQQQQQQQNVTENNKFRENETIM